MGKVVTKRSTAASSNLELMSGAEGDTDPRTLNTESGDDRTENAGAYPDEGMRWGPLITHEDHAPDVYPGVQGKWCLDCYAEPAKRNKK